MNNNLDKENDTATKEIKDLKPEILAFINKVKQRGSVTPLEIMESLESIDIDAEMMDKILRAL